MLLQTQSRSCWPRLLCTFLVFYLSLPAYSQEHVITDDEEAVKLAAADFIDAFNNLDWDRFEARWAQDATVFFPFYQPRRVEGRGPIIAVFHSLFDTLPERAAGPPYLSIQPLNTHVQMLGDSAIVTFHLGETSPLNRRTIVFAKRNNSWLIVHLHASRLFAASEE